MFDAATRSQAVKTCTQHDNWPEKQNRYLSPANHHSIDKAQNGIKSNISENWTQKWTEEWKFEWTSWFLKNFRRIKWTAKESPLETF